VEASALRHQAALPALAGRSPLLRLQSDERLVALVRRGNNGAFDALVHRYQPRLLAFCRHMLGSQEDAEDVLQEVFAASYNALLADDRPINARPWLYRIARNRSLNHLRKPRAAGQDSMDVFQENGGTTTADTVHHREEFRQIVADVQDLPETQRTALLLREIDALSYDQIAETMDTTVPSVKSLLVRARVGLAEAAEARLLTCEEVRFALGQVAEGLTKTTSPVRRHLKLCDRCKSFRIELKSTSKALAAVYPIGPLVVLKKFGLAKLGLGGGAAAGSAAAGASGSIAGGAGIAAGGAATAASGAAAGSAISAGLGTLVSKAAAGMAAAVIVTAGAVEVKQVAKREPAATASVAAAPAPTPAAKPAPKRPVAARLAAAPAPKAEAPKPAAPASTPAPAKPAAPAPVATTPPATHVPVDPIQEEEGTATLPPRTQPVVSPGDEPATSPAAPDSSPGQQGPPTKQPEPEPAPAPQQPQQPVPPLPLLP
jgi:RNA polymerase sigma factor (sigma-70 family)